MLGMAASERVRLARMNVGLATVKAAMFLCAILLVAACARSKGVERDSNQVPVQVANVGLDRESGAHYVVLEDRSGKRVLPILIGEEEARAIVLELHSVKPERPLTYELLRNIIQQTGNRVDGVVIGEVRDQVYYASIYLDRGRYRIDSRPSDAIALAVGVNAPIFVADKLFAAAQPVNPDTSASLSTAKGLGMTVQELTPALAEYFGIASESGVVVADIGPATAKAGLQRGDIITEIAGQKVQTIEQFSRYANAAAAAGDYKITIAVRRGRAARSITLDTSPSARAGSP